MASSSSDRALRDVQRLFNLGAVGSMTDAQLLDWVVSQRDDPAEAAFEELVHRHGPMVFRVCRSVLRDAHDAEDAFQATFLVLARRARSIRRHGSIASWLFGVAHRVASRARNRAMRCQARDRRVAEQTPEALLPAESDVDWELLHEEIDRLPERLRGPVTLCYLEGLSYGMAASQLALSEATLRGRLARARERLRFRLSRRGVTVPAGLAVAGAAAQAQAAVRESLVHSTVRIALGFMADDMTDALARGVLTSMLINQLKVAAVLLLLGIGSTYWTWHALAVAVDKKGHESLSQVDGRPPATVPSPVPKTTPVPPPAVYRLTGSVRLEGTGEPIARARLEVVPEDINIIRHSIGKVAETGADGGFAVDVPAGNIRVRVSDPPPGYLVASIQEAPAILTVGPDHPAINRDFRVRKGAIWTFRFARGSDQKPTSGYVAANGPGNRRGIQSRAQADEHGLARLTLPTEGGKISLAVSESAPWLNELQTGRLVMSLEWEPSFRPDELEEITRLAGKDRLFRLIDADGKAATLQVPDAFEPTNDKGMLVIRVAIPYRDSKDFTVITGQVLDEQGRPVAGARVGITAMVRRDPNALTTIATTDRQGRYRIRDIPRRAIDGRTLALRIVVTKEGYAGLESPSLTLKEGESDRPHIVDPVVLVRGVSLGGIALDHRGRPLAGTWIEAYQPLVNDGRSGPLQLTQTDGEGRFTFQHFHQGVVQLFLAQGNMFKYWTYLADGSPEEARLMLPEKRPEFDGGPALVPAPPPRPIEPGQIAPEWQVGSWSDGRDRKLANERGRVVVLYFWGITFWQSVSALPALGKLAAAFEPRGVEFLAIHNSDLDRAHVERQAHRVLAFKHALPKLALDQTRFRNHARGKTADVYGVDRLPVLIVIDRAGKIAFRSDLAAGDRNVSAVFTRILTDPQVMTEEKANRLVERALAEEIESVLK